MSFQVTPPQPTSQASQQVSTSSSRVVEGAPRRSKTAAVLIDYHIAEDEEGDKLPAGRDDLTMVEDLLEGMSDD